MTVHNPHELILFSCIFSMNVLSIKYPRKLLVETHSTVINMSLESLLSVLIIFVLGPTLNFSQGQTWGIQFSV